MRGFRHRRSGRSGFTSLLALLALILQSLMPLAHAAAMVAQIAPGTIVICTSEGPKQARIAHDGSLEPVEQTGKLPPACPGCPTGVQSAALPPPTQPAIAIAVASTEVTLRVDPAASPASPRYPPSHPRAPPASV